MTYTLPRRLGHVTLPPQDGRPVAVYLMPLPDGDPVSLHGTAALIWTLAAEGEADVPGALADLLETDVGTLREDTEAYLATLVRDGLLDWVP